MTRFHFSLSWQLILLLLVLISCKKKEMSIAGPFPLDGAQLSLEEAGSITFQWEIPDERQSEIKTQYFRLLQMESLKEENTQTTFQFATKHLQTVGKVNFVTLRQATQSIFVDNQIYLWEVIGENEADESFAVKDLAFFSIGKQPAFSTASVLDMLSSGCKKCALQLNDCNTVICTQQIPCPSENTHIATLANFDIVRNDGLKLSAESAGNQNNSPCIQVTDNMIKFIGDFTVNVPFEKINEVEPTIVKAFLFKGEELVPESSIEAQSFELNEEPANDFLALSSSTFNLYCASTGVPSYRAKIRLNMEFSVDENAAGPAYTVVFYLTDYSVHTHASPVLHQEGENRTTQEPFTHAHTDDPDLSNVEGCSDVSDDTKLSFYTCRDESNKHIGQHIVVVSLPICQ